MAKARKPIRKKYPRKPKPPRGGFKTMDQVKVYNQKADEWEKKCRQIDADYKKASADYQKFIKASETTKKRLSGLGMR